MSLPVLAIAADAVSRAEWPVDDEFDMGFGDYDWQAEEPRQMKGQEDFLTVLHVRWALYRTEGGALRLVVVEAAYSGPLVEAFSL